MDDKKTIFCPICGSEHAFVYEDDSYYQLIECDACGCYMHKKAGDWNGKPANYDKLASYLYYNGKINPPLHSDECEFYNVIGIKTKYDRLIEEGQCCYYVNNDIVETWYPKTFAEKVDMFLLGLDSRANFMGESIILTEEQINSACFVFRRPDGPMKNIDGIALEQRKYFLKYLLDKDLVQVKNTMCTILPEGQKRIDELQKNRSENSKNIFVAMAFSDDMKNVREKIKEAIISCGYIPRIMDEIQHNHQIVPEMLYEIKKAKCVVAELSKHNNGAYYEAGFALGTGKEVIHLCKKSSFDEDGHFDVKQVNTILWDNEDEIVKKLSDRIKATIF